ncbi:MAG: right-handed parallel beta-helix repeat-containing protein [Microbacteriaceae bacterium]|nr:right-handed parallel beta-helix repeat-containing protein [Burkholderiaceae bacterium]
MSRHPLVTLIALLPALLTACGGGDGSSAEANASVSADSAQPTIASQHIASTNLNMPGISAQAIGGATTAPVDATIFVGSGSQAAGLTAPNNTALAVAQLRLPTTRTDDRAMAAAAANATPSIGTDDGLKTAQSVAATTSQVVVFARADLAGNVGAQMELRAEGRLLGNTEVRATSLQAYTFTVPTLATTSVIDIVYTNDEMVAGIDRNLWVDSISVDGRTIAATASAVRYDVGNGAAAFDGVNVLPGQTGLFWNGALRVTLQAAGGAGVAGAGVYVDQVAGNDANPGTIAAPWKTFANLAAVRIAAGQGVFLQCGQIWRESLLLSATQLADGTAIAGYGSACATSRAVVSGADNFSGGWTQSGNVWSRAVRQGTPQISRLFVNGQSHRTARWPNASATSQGYALTAAGSATSATAATATAADRATLSSNDLSGTTIHIRTKAWMIESRPLSGYNATSGTLSFAPAMQYETDAGEGYILEGKLWMLDVPGEFVHDAAAGRLYVYAADATAQANLNAALVEGSVRDTPVALSQAADVRVSNIAARMGRADGFALLNMPGAVLDNVEGSGNARAGVRLAQDTSKVGPTVRASRFDDNWMLGIDATFAGASLITGNTVTATGTIAANGWSQGAIRTDAGAKVQDNRIDGSAYHGIHFSGTGGTQITGNTVTGYCLRLADCGGIYTWNGGKTTTNQSSVVEANQLLTSSANAEGATGFGTDVVAGIFLDDFATGAAIRNNMVYGAPIGVQVHNGFGNTVEGNKLWLPTVVALLATMDQNDKDWMVGNIFRNNQIVPVKTGSAVFPAMPTFQESYPIWFFNNLSGSAGITSGSNVFTGNQVVRLDGSLDGVHAWIRSNTQNFKLSSASWATFNPTDVRTATPLTFAMYTLLFGPEMVTGGNFDTGLGPWSSWFGGSSTPGSVQASSGGAGCIGTCMQVLPGTTGDYLSSPPFSLKPNAPYLYTYTARMAQPATLQYPYIGRAVTPYDSMATDHFSSSSKLSGVAGEVIRYEGFFTAKSSDLAKVYLQSTTVGVPVFYDNVSVRELTGYSFSTAADWSALAYAPRSGGRTVTCASLGWGSNCTAVGLDGTAVALPTTLAAGTQQLFLRTDSIWRR